MNKKILIFDNDEYLLNIKENKFKTFFDLMGICLNYTIQEESNNVCNNLLNFIISILRYNKINPKIQYKIFDKPVLFGEIVFTNSTDPSNLNLYISKAMLNQYLNFNVEAPKIIFSKNEDFGSIFGYQNVSIVKDTKKLKNWIKIFIIADHFCTHYLEGLITKELDFVSHKNFGNYDILTLHSFFKLTNNKIELNLELDSNIDYDGNVKYLQ